MSKDMGVPASPSRSRPSDGAEGVSTADAASVPNAVKMVTWRANKKLRGLTVTFSRYRSVSVALGRTKSRGKTWAVTFKGMATTRSLAIPADTMDALIECVRRIKREERLLASGWQTVGQTKWQASAIEAATAGETTKIGSTDGESAVAKPDAPEQSHD